MASSQKPGCSKSSYPPGKKMKLTNESINAVGTASGSGAAKKNTKPAGPATFLRPSGKNMDWDYYLELPGSLPYLNKVAPVGLFKHAPLADVWSSLTQHTGSMVVEVPNLYLQPHAPLTINWYARVLLFAGYKCLIEYVNVWTNHRCMNWASFCSDVVKPLGFSAKNSILAFPPMAPTAIKEDMFTYFMEIHELVKDRPTVAENHSQFIANELNKTHKWPIGTTVEAVDTGDFYITKLATIRGWVGDRMLYSFGIDDISLCSTHSDMVHPLGWSRIVGHETNFILEATKFKLLEPNALAAYPTDVFSALKAGEFLEVRHPGRPYQIVAARIFKMLNYGYFYVIIRSNEAELKKPLICAFHILSPYIFQCGFCKDHQINLIPPITEPIGIFDWDKHFNRYNLKPASLDLLPARPTPKFEVGMKFEAVDEVSPLFLGAATITKIRGHLLQIHYDGYCKKTRNTYCWIDFESPNIYPAGYGEMVCHEFQGQVDLSPRTAPGSH